MQGKRPPWILVATVAIAAFLALGSREYTDDAPVTPPQNGPDLLSVFAQHDDPGHSARDARDLARLCRAIAEQIDYDAKREKPRLTTGQQLDDLRRWAREYFLTGKSLGTEYPKLRDEIKDFLDERLGDEGGPLTPEQRRKWVSAFQDIAKAADYAAWKLDG